MVVQAATVIDEYLRTMEEVGRGLPRAEIARAVDVLFGCWQREGTVFTAGNGGSASTATHLACDLAEAAIGPGGGGGPGAAAGGAGYRPERLRRRRPRPQRRGLHRRAHRFGAVRDARGRVLARGAAPPALHRPAPADRGSGGVRRRRRWRYFSTRQTWRRSSAGWTAGSWTASPPTPASCSKTEGMT